MKNDRFLASYDRNDMCHTITRIQNRSSEVKMTTFVHRVDILVRIQRQNCLDTNVQPLDVEGLEHYFGHAFSVFRGVHRGLSQHENMVLRVHSKVVEDGSVPKLLHQLPVLDLACRDRVDELVGGCMLESFISDVEIQVIVLHFADMHCPLKR